ncbi:carotenoid family protein [Salix suchowensis]|nr:carotenoid family protein [Salix suchowensis]
MTVTLSKNSSLILEIQLQVTPASRVLYFSANLAEIKNTTLLLYEKKDIHCNSCCFHHKLQVPTLLDRETQENGVVAGCPIVELNPQPQKGLASKLIDCLEKLITKLMCDHTSLSHPFLSGNFAPVLEETAPVKDLPVEGHLPECMNGEFVRVGPNPKFAPVAGYNWLDGDGMIHGLRIKDGKAAYVNRFVRTSRLKQEEFFGGAKFTKIGDLKGLFGLLMVSMEILRQKTKVLDKSYGCGTGNTSLIYHNGKLLALHEVDKPYVVKVLEDGDLQTIGLLDYDKRLNHPFTAHPKVDPFTGEMFTFGCSLEPPYVTYRVISKDDPIIMHDFAITENYAVFLDLPFTYSHLMQRKSSFGVLPRYAKDDLLIKWFELPNCFIFHNANAWEEDDEIVLITFRLQEPYLDMANGAVKEKLEKFVDELYQESAVDFPSVNESYTGRKQRYVYGNLLDSIAQVTGIVKFDLHSEPEPGKGKIEVGGNVKGIFDLGPGRFGSEAIFVPSKPGTTSEEDDGYLIFFAHDENTG